MKKKEKELVILAAWGFAFLAMGWILSIQPGLSKLGVARQQLLDAQMRAELISEVQQLQLKHKSASALFAKEMSQNDFVAMISALANQNGLKFDSLVPTTELKGSYTRLTLNLRAKASFPVLIKFLEQAEGLKPVVIISKISMRSAGSYQNRDFEVENPEVDLVLETYLKKN